MASEHQESQSKDYPTADGGKAANSDGDSSGDRSSPSGGVPQPPQSPPTRPMPPEKHGDWHKKATLVIETLGLSALIVYTVFSILQWAQIRWTNRLTRESIDGNTSSLQQTLGKMTWQIQEPHEIAKQTLDLARKSDIQAKQTTNLATDTHILALTSRDALIEVQRAVVVISNATVFRHFENGAASSLLVFIQWKNSGQTPTKNLTFSRNGIVTPTRLPDNYAFKDVPDQQTKSFLGPQSIANLLPISIPIATAKDINDGKLVLTTWGQATYRDVFKGTPTHITHYCYIVTGFYGSPTSTGTDVTTLKSENCKTHNCHDDECYSSE